MKTIIINIFILFVVAIFCQAQPQQIILQLNEDITMHQLISSQTSCIEAEEVKLELDKLIINNANREMHIDFEMKGKSSLKIRLFNIAGVLVHQQILPKLTVADMNFVFHRLI